MNNINKTKLTGNIIFSFGVLAVFAFGTLAIPTQTNAQYGGYYGGAPYYGGTPYIDYSTSSSYQAPPAPVYYTAPPTAPAAPAPVPITPTIYSNNTNPNTTAVATVTKKVSKPAAPSNLAANVVYGENSFLPSGLIQWILFAILILLLVILVRKIFGADKEYHETPMKHA